MDDGSENARQVDKLQFHLILETFGFARQLWAGWPLDKLSEVLEMFVNLRTFKKSLSKILIIWLNKKCFIKPFKKKQEDFYFLTQNFGTKTWKFRWLLSDARNSPIFCSNIRPYSRYKDLNLYVSLMNSLKKNKKKSQIWFLEHSAIQFQGYIKKCVKMANTEFCHTEIELMQLTDPEYRVFWEIMEMLRNLWKPSIASNHCLSPYTQFR